MGNTLSELEHTILEERRREEALEIDLRPVSVGHFSQILNVLLQSTPEAKSEIYIPVESQIRNALKGV